ncbi:polysaccharide biosynthesis tyrosine autokinase [Nitrospinae bacterium AH_259_B05_G02_I21]|nr:polysaccharide biosynthesis tyrosine autokinase [Nitrospinae bacterium AH_259_B05_G02_I21]MDA2932453.1 polysaccharide biosynthesis tyrosine autokinase [Nitrospinae bacterium AH-259-F20]
MAQYDFNLRDYWRVFRKRKFTVIVTTVMLAALTFIFATYQEVEPIYQASAAIKISRNVPLGSGGRGAFLAAFRTGEDIDTQRLLIRSFPVMVRSAKQLGLVDPKLSAEAIRKNPELLKTVLALKDQIETEREGFTEVATITATANNPVMAQRIANTVAQAFRQWDFQQKNKQVDEARRFIERQLGTVKAELETGEDEIKLYKERTGSVPVATQASEDFSALTQAERALADTEDKLKEVSIILKHLREEKRLPAQEELGRPGASPSSVYQTMKDNLNRFLVERDTLLLEFTDQHPDVKALTIKIDETIQNMLEQLEAEQNTLRRKRESLEAKLGEMKERIAGYPQMGLRLARLDRSVKVNAATFAHLQERYQDILIRTAQRVYDVTIIRPAVPPSEPINQPAVFAITVVGIFLGVLLGGVLAFVFETLDTSIGAIEDVESFLEVPVLGLIPFIEVDKTIKKLQDKATTPLEGALKDHAMLLLHYDSRSNFAESFRALRTNIQYLHLEKDYKTFLVTSTNPLEGKTSISANLALTFAQMGKKTLLLDADLRKPNVHSMFGLNRHIGLTDILLGNQPWQETVKSVPDLLLGPFELDEILQTPGMDNLHIITCGTIPTNPTEILHSDMMSVFIEELREAYDYVLIDTPPTIPVSDAAILGARCDGVVFVYEVGKIARSALRRAKFLIENVKGEVVGIVLNKIKAEVSPDFYELGYYRYYHKDSYGRGIEDDGKKRGLLGFLFRRKSPSRS